MAGVVPLDIAKFGTKHWIESWTLALAVIPTFRFLVRVDVILRVEKEGRDSNSTMKVSPADTEADGGT